MLITQIITLLFSVSNSIFYSKHSKGIKPKEIVTTPIYEAPSRKVYVIDENTNVPCLLFEADIFITVFDKVNDSNFRSEIKLTWPTTYNVTGVCGGVANSLTISWTPDGYETPWNLTQNFDLFKEKYGDTEVKLQFYTDENVLREGVYDNALFITPVGSTYICGYEQNLTVYSDERYLVQVSMSNMVVEAFRSSKYIEFEGYPIRCVLDVSQQNLVMIVVGTIFGLLLLGVLIGGCAVATSRSYDVD